MSGQGIRSSRSISTGQSTNVICPARIPIHDRISGAGYLRPAAALLCIALLLAILPTVLMSAPKEDGDFFSPPLRNHVTFWGHACCYIDVDGFGIVTDPVFQKTTDWRRRKVPAPPAESYANAGLILVSHGHGDHLSRNTIRTFPETATILCSSGCSKYLDDGDVERVAFLPDDDRPEPDLGAGIDDVAVRKGRDELDPLLVQNSGNQIGTVHG